jgi:hypothetical protein
VYADDVIPGISFQHKDWELACDNTRTCRAAGYQADDNDLAVSVLLTRMAGQNQSVMAQVMLGSYEEDDPLGDLPDKFKVKLSINGKNVGFFQIDKDSLVANLSQAQVNALLASLRDSSTIEFSAGKHVWSLSDQGAAAVLLKMDEFQGRIGTTGALIKRGKRNEDSVLKAVPVPVVIQPPLVKIRQGDSQIVKDKALLKELMTDDDEKCSGLQEGTVELADRLSDHKLLVTTQCWLAAYNAGSGYWVINDTPPYNPELVTTSASDYGSGNISASQKGRGLGDCWSREEWNWDGKQFIQTESSSTGMCKLVAPGGAWILPTITMNVQPKK